MLIFRKGAVTGGLSCGKSTVCRILKELGAYVMSADEIVHKLLSPKTDIGQKVVNLIGAEILIDGQIDRSVIAKKVFNQPHLLQSLENLLHPAVQEEIETESAYVESNQLASVFIAEIPLLFETGGERFFDFTIAVVADVKQCQERFIKATHKSIAEFEKRSARQLSMEEKAQKATYTIVNNNSLADLKLTVAKLYTNLTT